MAPEPVLTPADEALLDRLAARVVELRMETPAILALESARPLRLVASQGMLFLEPLVQSLGSFSDWRRWSELAGRPEAIEHLVRRIEAHAETAHATRRGKPIS
jgi:hypothetical protein